MSEPLDLEPIKERIGHVFYAAAIMDGRPLAAEFDCRDLLAEVDRLRAQIAAVRTLHAATPAPVLGEICYECGRAWPCPTLRVALDGAS